jgi:hypothetical protein
VLVVDFCQPLGLLPQSASGGARSAAAAAADDARLLLVCRLLTGVAAVCVLFAALLIGMWGLPIVEVSAIINAVTGGPLLGLFLLGLFTTRGTASGASVGLTCSCGIMAAILLAASLCPARSSSGNSGNSEDGGDGRGCAAPWAWLGSISIFMYAFIGSFATVLLGWVCSQPPEGHVEAVSRMVVEWSVWAPRRRDARGYEAVEMAELRES